MGIYSTLDHLHARGARDGHERGVREGACRQLAKLLARHGKRRFNGPPPEGQRRLLDSLVDRVALAPLEQAAERFLAAVDWPDLLAGLAAPDEGPAEPAYLVPFEFDPTPMPPSIDEYARVTRKGGEQAVVHLRLQRLYQENIGEVLHRESKQLEGKYRCPVETAVLLLWPGADGPGMTGEHPAAGGKVFRYHVTRLWQKDVEEMFSSMATAVYAPLGDFPPEQLPEVVRRVDEIIEAQARTAQDSENLWVVVYSSMGLRWPAERVNELLAHRLPFLYQTKACRGTLSEGYYDGQSRGQEEGLLQGARRWVLTLGRQRLGEPPAGVAGALETVRGVDRLEQLASRVLTGASWQEVLAPG